MENASQLEAEKPHIKLQRLLREVHWPKTALAKATGDSIRTVHRWTSGTAPIPELLLPALEYLARHTAIAKHMMVPVPVSSAPRLPGPPTPYR